MFTREEILAIYSIGPEAVIYVIHRLETITEEQAIRIAELEERVKVLESSLNQNSRNSSKSFFDRFFFKRRSLILLVVEKRVARNLEVRVVIRGQVLKMVNHVDQIIEYSLNCCEGCGHFLEDLEVETY